MTCTRNFHSTIGYQVASTTSIVSTMPARCSSKLVNWCLKGKDNAWHLIWICPANFITSATSAVLEVAACTVMLVAAAILAIKGAATKDIVKRAEWLKDSKTMTEIVIYMGILFGLTLVNFLYPAIKFHNKANKLNEMICKATTTPTPVLTTAMTTLRGSNIHRLPNVL